MSDSWTWTPEPGRGRHGAGVPGGDDAPGGSGTPGGWPTSGGSGAAAGWPVPGAGAPPYGSPQVPATPRPATYAPPQVPATPPPPQAPAYVASPPPPAYPPPDASPFGSQFTVYMPGQQPGVQTWSLEVVPRRRRRTGLWVGAGLGVVALAGVAVAGWLLVGQKLIAPASPTAAVDRLVDGIEHKDGLALLGALPPDEVRPFQQLATEVNHDTGTATADPATVGALTDAFGSLTVSVDGLQLRAETLDDGLAKVTFTAGTVTVDGDAERIADALVAAASEGDPQAAQDTTAMHDEIVTSLAGALPYTLDFADEQTFGDTPFYVVTVREGHGWYVSPLMSLGDYMTLGQGVTRGAMPRDADVAHPADPKAAATQLAAAIPDLVHGDTHSLVSVLPQAERRFVAVYLQPLLDQEESSSTPVDVTLTASDFAVADQTDDRASVVPTDLAYTVAGDGQSGTMSFDGDCLTTTVDGSTAGYHACISDVPLLTELGLDHPALVAVHEGDGWYVSAISTYAETVRTVLGNLRRLALEGKFDDPQWMQQQLPSLVGLMGGVYDAGPQAEAPDPALDALAAACVDGDMASCDQLIAQAPQDSAYWQVGSTCGERVDVWTGGSCTSLGAVGTRS